MDKMSFVYRKKPLLTLRGATDSWEFTQSTSQTIASGQRKIIYRGQVHGADSCEIRPAIAKVFGNNHMQFFVEELHMAYEQHTLGIGPSFFYALAEASEASRGSSLVIVEEDLGVNLEKAVFDKQSPEYEYLFPNGMDCMTIKKKLFFDVCTTLYHLQDSGYCHRDLRLANICAYWPQGSKTPCDIRATPIDYELCTNDVRARKIPAAARRYYEALFPDFPIDTNAASALMMDLGYLAALWFELDTERPIYPPNMPMTDYSGVGIRIYPDKEFEKLSLSEKESGNCYPLSAISDRLFELFDSLPFSSIKRSIVFFFRGREGQLDVRPLSKSLDIDDLGGYLDSFSRQFDSPETADTNDFAGIISISNTPWSDDVKEYVAGKINHGGFIDRRDLMQLKNDVMFVLEQAANDDAPRAYQQSAYDPEAHRQRILAYPHFMSLIGCRMKLIEHCTESDIIVRDFSEAEVELLARAEHRRWMAEKEAAGFVFGDGSGNTNECMLPWDALSDAPESAQRGGKDYDRNAFRGEKLHALLDHLASRGLVVVREQD